LKLIFLFAQFISLVTKLLQKIRKIEAESLMLISLVKGNSNGRLNNDISELYRKVVHLSPLLWWPTSRPRWS